MDEDYNIKVAQGIIYHRQIGCPLWLVWSKSHEVLCFVDKETVFLQEHVAGGKVGNVNKF